MTVGIIPDRVFVGNLPYAVSEEQVASLTPALPVLAVEIPRRHYHHPAGQVLLQSKGYGFVTYACQAHAEQALAQIAGQRIDGREVYARHALPQKQPQAQAQQQQSQSQGKQHGDRPDFAHCEPFYPQALAAAPPPLVFYSVVAPPMAHAGRLPARSYHAHQRPVRGPPVGSPSDTTVFIGNLKRTVSVSELMQFLLPTQPLWAKIPRVAYPPHIYHAMRQAGEIILNKGIAFVEYATHDAQQHAIALFHEKWFKGKQLNVMVAISNGSKKHDDDEDVAVDDDTDESDIELVLKSTAPTSADEK